MAKRINTRRKTSRSRKTAKRLAKKHAWRNKK
jgi:hypothetical protein